MALTAGGIASMTQGDPQGLIVQANGAVYENSNIISDSQGNGEVFSSQTYARPPETFNSIKNTLTALFRTNFNLQTGRTDGNTIQFIWLDDRGLL